MIFDTTACELGEGALWHPGRQALFWFDILHKRLHMKGAGGLTVWEMPELTSAAGILDDDRLLIASESALSVFEIATGSQSRLVALDAEDTGTRSNDGRADRQGGFWIGTMGKRGPQDVGRGAIWRFYKGELRWLFPGITIPNSICFTPDGRFAHFSDTPTQKVWRVALDAEGWPVGAPEVFLDLTAEGLYPDGAVIAADGTFWNAQWGAGRVAAYAPDGTFLRAVTFDGSSQTSCPAFGGPDLTTLFCTSAQEGMDAATRAANPNAGMTFTAPDTATGLPEPVVIL
jgi:sugar lactone lactonase YvrE